MALPRGYPRARAVALIGGLAAAVVALVPPVDVWADERLSWHVVQHFLLVFVAAPLVCLGAPLTLLARAGGGPRLARSGRSSVARVVSHPVVAWLALAAVQVGVHATGFYEEALRNPWLHAVEHALFLGAGLLFWWPVVGLDPPRRVRYPARIALLMLAMPLEAAVAVWLLSATTVLYPHYALVDGYAAALSDQNTAGALMWILGTLAPVVASLFVAADWRRTEVRRQERAEARR